MLKMFRRKTLNKLAGRRDVLVVATMAQPPSPPAKEMMVEVGDIIQPRGGHACPVSKVEHVIVDGERMIPWIWSGTTRISHGWSFVRTGAAEASLVRQHTPSGLEEEVKTVVKAGPVRVMSEAEYAAWLRG